MSQTVNISKNKVLRFTVGVLLVCVALSLIIAANVRHNNGLVKDLKLEMINDGHIAISKDDISRQLMSQPRTNYKKESIKNLDLAQMEQTIEKNPWVKNAEVFINNKDELQINIDQNIPVARVFSTSGVSYYLDSAMQVLPATISFPYATPIFTNVPYLSNDAMSKKIKSSIASVGSVIYNDSFWNAQITQIKVNNDVSFEATSLMGDFNILLGDTSNMKEKLRNLKVFYQKGLKKVGWNTYQTIDARFNGQIVASPGIGYVAPIVKDTLVALPDDVKATALPKPKQTTATAPKETPKAATPAKAKESTVANKPSDKKKENNQAKPVEQKPKYTLPKKNN